ncbi:MAG: hypothetical protein AAFX06_10195 [Planctomycetota bacterium]
MVDIRYHSRSVASNELAERHKITQQSVHDIRRNKTYREFIDPELESQLTKKFRVTLEIKQAILDHRKTANSDRETAEYFGCGTTTVQRIRTSSEAKN